MSKRSKHHKYVVYEQKCKKWQNHAPDYDGCNHTPRWRVMTILAWQPGSLVFGPNRSGIQKTYGILDPSIFGAQRKAKETLATKKNKEGNFFNE